MPSANFYTFDIETAREMYRQILEEENGFYTDGRGSFFRVKKKTVVEKIQELWERSNYYQMRKKIEELQQAMLASKKQKPYFRRHERW